MLPMAIQKQGSGAGVFYGVTLREPVPLYTSRPRPFASRRNDRLFNSLRPLFRGSRLVSDANLDISCNKADSSLGNKLFDFLC